jgi:hypothetical protein
LVNVYPVIESQHIYSLADLDSNREEVGGSRTLVQQGGIGVDVAVGVFQVVLKGLDRIFPVG